MGGLLIDAKQQQAGKRYNILYCTTSKYKHEEITEISKALSVRIPDDEGARETQIGDLFNFSFKHVDLIEILNRDIREMVLSKATKAYEIVKVPCLVEHAGLIFSEYKKESYPGGLTQPMWDALADNGRSPKDFVTELKVANRTAIARAVVGYCDGKRVRTFVGETEGTISASPKGKRQFYWDTVFKPTEATGKAGGLTYAEIAEHPDLGVAYKVTISQSAKAMQKCLQYIAEGGDSGLFAP